MLMQTMQRLGMTVVGRQFDAKGDAQSQKAHETLNPKGYFENPDIYYCGPSSMAFQSLLEKGRADIACKMDVRHFVEERQFPFWIDAAADISSILLSYRLPSEQAHSEFLSGVDAVQQKEAASKFTFVTRFLRDYVETYGAVDPLLGSDLQPLASKLDYVAYSEAKRPEVYARRICSILGLQPTPEQMASAIGNISPELFRVEDRALSEEERSWASQLGASAIYSQMENSRAVKMAPRSRACLSGEIGMAKTG